MKRIEIGKWCISSGGELYNADDYDTKEDAILAGKEDYKWNSFYVAKVVNLEFEASDISLSDEAYENLSEQLFEEVGEVSETWDNLITNDQLKELDEMIGKTVIEWVNKNNLQPECFGISGECKIEAE